MEQGGCCNGHTVGQSSSPSLAVAVEVLEVLEVVGIELAEWQVVATALFHVHILRWYRIRTRHGISRFVDM